MGASRRTARSAIGAGGFPALLRFAGAMARRRFGTARRALRAVARAARPRSAAEEVALMLVLHAGFPAALEGLRILDDVWPGRPRPGREGGVRDWARRGERLCRRVYGPAYLRLIASVERLHPTLARWMVEQGYGRILSRPRLDARSRELVAVAVLAAGGWRRQLVSHLLGATRLGCDRASVRRAFRIGLGYADAAGRAAAARAWRDAFAGVPPRLSRPSSAGRARRPARRRPPVGPRTRGG